MALEHYNQAVESNPMDARGYRYRGVLNYKSANYQLAKTDFEKWRDKDSKNPMVHRWLARTYAHLGLMKDSLDSAKEAAILGGPLSEEEQKELETLPKR